ncbi:MAG: cupin domain-containing protein [Mariniphaga sp.]|nr:cupin domain-containing protein [Mariniphaga sp.]
MKVLFLTVFILGITSGITDNNQVESKVYSFSKAKVEKTETGEKRQFMDGPTFHMENFEIHTTMLKPGNAPHGSQLHTDGEELVIIKEGKLEITINNESKVMGAGSVALIMPGDEHGLKNAGETNATYYIVKYKSKSAIDNERAKNAGGSKLFNWDDLEFKPHDRGGVRSYFDQKSSMSERIEMHVTTLNSAIKSHEPHTHGPAEIVIMMAGTTEMEIGDSIYQGEVGDIYFLESDIPHAIRNTGTEPCMYMAFQWE